jgi:hypothetical protein
MTTPNSTNPVLVGVSLPSSEHHAIPSEMDKATSFTESPSSSLTLSSESSSQAPPRLPLRWVLAALWTPVHRLRVMIRTMLLGPHDVISGGVVASGSPASASGSASASASASGMVSRLPIVEFYRYMWTTNKPLFAATLFVNYLMPLIFEGNQA